MTTEATEPQVEQVQEQHQETAVSDDAAFAAGFAQARGEEPPAAELEEQQTDTPTEETQQAAPEPQAVLAGLTEDQLKALLAKAGEVDAVKADFEQRVRQAFGKIGEVNSEVKALVQRMEQGRGNGVKLNADSLKRMHGEFPEMAEMLAQDLSDAFAGQGGGQVDPAAIDKIVTERLSAKEAEIERKIEKRFLKRAHPTWEQDVVSDDFRLWKDNVLPKDQAALLDNSWDSDFVGEKLTEWKAWKVKTAEAREVKERTKEVKQNRLAAAVAPQGAASGGPPTINEDDAFMRGFKAVRG